MSGQLASKLMSWADSYDGDVGDLMRDAAYCIDAQAATIARLEAENAQMRSLISSRPDAPQAFWDDHRVALEVARQQAAYWDKGTKT